MKIVFFLGLFFTVPLLWDAYSSASANRGLQPVEVLPAMKIQIRSGGANGNSRPETMRPGDMLYFRQGRRSE
jgi:hypothetical protein